MGKGSKTVLRSDGSNFVEWFNDVRDYLATEKLVVYLNNPAPAGRDAATALEQDMQALGFLRLSCEPAVKQMLTDCQTPVAAVALLRQQFRSASEAKRVMLEREKHLVKGDDEPMAQYFQRARTLRNDIVAAGGQWDEADMRVAILTGLPQSYNRL